jgi:hypothetical protein
VQRRRATARRGVAEKVTDPRRLASCESKIPCHRLNETLYPTVIFLPFYAGGVLSGVIVDYLRAGNRRNLLCENEHAALLSNRGQVSATRTVPNEGRLRVCRDVADPALETGTIFGLADREAIRDAISGRHVVALVLEEANRAGLAAPWAVQRFGSLSDGGLCGIMDGANSDNN